MTLFVLCYLFSGAEAFYPTSDTLGVGEHKDSEQGINRMVEDLEKQYVMYRQISHILFHSSAIIIHTVRLFLYSLYLSVLMCVFLKFVFFTCIVFILHTFCLIYSSVL